MEDFDKFLQKRRLQEPAENNKIIVVFILMVSLFVFSIMEKEDVKQIIWYWAALMTALLIGCMIQDIMISKKIKEIDSTKGK